MAIKNNKRGFALLIAIIFMSVMLSLGLALSSVSYKQAVLASGAIASQYAFYAADAALECALFADQRRNLFDYASHATSHPDLITSVTCSGMTAADTGYAYSSSRMVVSQRLSLYADTRCADVTVYKPKPGTGTTYLFSQGYDVSCAAVNSASLGRIVSRGESIHY